MPIPLLGAAAAPVLGYVARGVGASITKDAVKSLLADGAKSTVRRRVARGITGRVVNAAKQLKESVYAHAWAVDSASNMMERFLAASNSKFGTFAHTISVTCQGGPQASLRRIWYLALSAAFGRLRNRVAGVQACSIEATWDVTGKACSVTIGYTNSGLIGGLQAFGGSKASSPLGPFQRGPDQVTVGGSWPSFLTAFNARQTTTSLTRVIGGALSAAPGLKGIGQLANFVAGDGGKSAVTVSGSAGAIPTWQPIFDLNQTVVPDVLVKMLQSYGATTKNVFVELPRVNAGGELLPWARVLPLNVTVAGSPYGSYRNSTGTLLPILPDDGRVITTGQKGDPRIQPPRPPIDGKTRMALVSLVSQSLSSPGILPTTPPEGFGPIASPGVYIYAPGLGLEDADVSNGKFTQAADAADLDLPPIVPSPITPESAGFGPDGYKLQQVIPNVRE